MSFKDTWEPCSSCGRQFVFTVELQRHLQSSGRNKEEVCLCAQCAPREESGVPTQTREMRLDPVTGHWVGNVKWFDAEKGYGFIDRGDGTDIFFHKTSVIGSPATMVELQAVTYGVEETLKGPQAIEVQLFEM